MRPLQKRGYKDNNLPAVVGAASHAARRGRQENSGRGGGQRKAAAATTEEGKIGPAEGGMRCRHYRGGVSGGIRGRGCGRGEDRPTEGGMRCRHYRGGVSGGIRGRGCGRGGDRPTEGGIRWRGGRRGAGASLKLPHPAHFYEVAFEVVELRVGFAHLVGKRDLGAEAEHRDRAVQQRGLQDTGPVLAGRRVIL